MLKTSAGILAFRVYSELEVLLVHPGGPFYARKDLGVWSIPKGEYITERPLDVALLEFTEETGNIIGSSDFIELGAVRLKSGKTVLAWAVETDFERPYISSNSFEMEWPPRSGKVMLFPEVDKAEWFTMDIAKQMIHPAQIKFLDTLEIILKNKS